MHSPLPAPFAVRLTRRQYIEHRWHEAGDVVLLGYLLQAVGLVRSGAAEPANDETRLAVRTTAMRYAMETKRCDAHARVKWWSASPCC